MQVTCPYCQRSLQVDSQYAGRIIRCPSCTNDMIVPARRKFSKYQNPWVGGSNPYISIVVAVGAIFITLILSVLWWQARENLEELSISPSTAPKQVRKPESTKRGAKTIEEIFQEASKAVVVIMVICDSNENEMPEEDVREGEGSGFIFNSNGLIATNYHLIENASCALVVMEDEIMYEARGVVVSDREKDLAIIKINAKNLPTIELGDSDYIRIGQRVVTIGHPERFYYTPSTGIVSGVRLDEKGQEWIQLEVAASPGSSGGPVLSDSAKVIGVICGSWPEGQSLNFAVPINYLKDLMSQVTPTKISYPETTFWTSDPPLDGRHIDELLKE